MSFFYTEKAYVPYEKALLSWWKVRSNIPYSSRTNVWALFIIVVTWQFCEPPYFQHEEPYFEDYFQLTFLLQTASSGRFEHP